MIIIGLTGSIAMGKSEVANLLGAQGIPIFDADAEVHALYASAQGVALLKPFLPDAIVEGKVDRSVLSQLVLGYPQKLEKLEQLVHAEIVKRRSAFLAGAENQGQGIVVVDVPLLFETGAQKQVDVTVVVSAPEQLQRRRALARPGMTPEKLDNILKRQMPDIEKCRLANYVIINDGTLDDLRKNTLAVLTNIKKEHRL